MTAPQSASRARGARASTCARGRLGVSARPTAAAVCAAARAVCMGTRRLVPHSCAPLPAGQARACAVAPTAHVCVRAVGWGRHGLLGLYHRCFREGSGIKWLCSVTFLFKRAAGEENFDPEVPNKRFLLDFEVG